MGRFLKIGVWFKSIRPRTLPAAAAPVIIGLALAFYENKTNLFIAIFTLIAALLIQIGTNLANDYFDFIKGADTDKRVGPVRLIQAGLIKKNEMLAAFIIAFIAASALGVFLVMRGGYPVLLTG